MCLFLCAFHAFAAGNATPGSLLVAIEDTVSSYLDSGYEVKLAITGTSNGAAANGEFLVVTGEGRTAARGQLKDGLLEGDFLIYSDAGSIIMLSRFKRGRPSGATVSWGSDGQVTGITPYNEAGMKHGTEISYRQGKSLIETFWENGEPLEIRLHDNGLRVLHGEEMRDWFKGTPKIGFFGL